MIRNKLPSAVLKSIYNALVQLHILHGIELYANTYAIPLGKLTSLFNFQFFLFFNILPYW
jgi:hypothetical protein